MSYRVRYTMPDGRTGLWTHDYQTREAAQAAIDDRLADTGFAYTVEEAPDPKPKSTSTTERLVGLLRDRHALGLAKYGTTLDRTDLAPEEWAQHAIDEALDLAGYLMRVKDWFAPEPGSTAAHVANHVMHVRLSRAIELGDAMHRAMTTAQSRFYVDWEEIKVALAEWTAYKESLAASHQGTAKASEALGEGGDSDRRRLEALERWLRGNTYRMVYFSTRSVIVAGSDSIGDDDMEAPTLAALADKLAEKEDKP